MEKEKHDEWYTQKNDYQIWCDKYKIYPQLDIAGHEDWHMCSIYCTKKLDALSKESWELDDGRVVDIWMNPPLLKGSTKKFVLKAEEQWRKLNMNILSVVPTGVISRKWFRHLWIAFKNGDGIEIDPIDRPTFLERGVLGQQSRNDYIVLCFRKR